MKQGEKLLLLIRRSGKQVKDVAEQFDVLPTSLSRMLKSEILTSKIKQKAIAVFGLSADYFESDNDVVEEPTYLYGIKPEDEEQRLLLIRIKEQKEEIARLLEERKGQIEKERELLEIIKALSKTK